MFYELSANFFSGRAVFHCIEIPQIIHFTAVQFYILSLIVIIDKAAMIMSIQV